MSITTDTRQAVPVGTWSLDPVHSIFARGRQNILVLAVLPVTLATIEHDHDYRE